jgi:predicted membrane metal-binding protein
MHSFIRYSLLRAQYISNQSLHISHFLSNQFAYYGTFLSLLFFFFFSLLFYNFVMDKEFLDYWQKQNNDIHFIYY